MDSGRLKEAGLIKIIISISRVLRGSLTMYLYHLNIHRDSLPKFPVVAS